MNNDLISREALQQEALKLALKYSEIDDYGVEVYEMIEYAPAVDAVEVVHAKWVYYKKKDIAVCSSCSFERKLDDDFGKAISCPNCGADMRGE